MSSTNSLRERAATCMPYLFTSLPTHAPYANKALVNFFYTELGQLPAWARWYPGFNRYTDVSEHLKSFSSKFLLLALNGNKMYGYSLDKDFSSGRGHFLTMPNTGSILTYERCPAFLLQA